MEQVKVLLGMAIMGIVGIAGAACTGAEELQPDNSNAAEISAYDVPETPTIRPGSLRAFDVHPDGRHEEAHVWPGYETKNWDWGEEGSHSPSNSQGGIEVEDILSPGQVLTGFGARVDGSAVTRLRLRARSILPNWSWDPVGSTWQDWVRHPADDGGNEAELNGIALLHPYVAVGVGVGITNHNIAVYRLRKRKYSPVDRKLIEAESEDSVGVGPGELYWDTGFITQTAAQKAKMVIVGLGLRENNDNVVSMRVWAAYLD